MSPKLTTNGKLLKVFSEDDKNMVIFIPKQKSLTLHIGFVNYVLQDSLKKLN